MLVAENQLRERCYISKIKAEEINSLRSDQWFCPGCKSSVIIKNGKKIRPHFAHKNKSSCNMFSENESEEHLKGKDLIASNCEKFNVDYQLEAFLPELNQRPDVLINQKIAIEFQCSSLSIERFKERSDTYLKHGYQVVWLLGKSFHLKGKLSLLQQQFIYYTHQVGFYLWELDVDEEAISLDYFILATYLEISHRRKKFSLKSFSFLKLLSVPNEFSLKENQKVQSSFEYQEQQKKWNQQLNMKQPKAMTLQSFCYQKGQNLRNIDMTYFYPSFLTPLLMAEELRLRFLVYEYLMTYGKGTFNQLLQLLKTEGYFETYSLVSEEQLLGYCLSLYLCFLKEQKIICSDNEGQYRLKNRKASKEIKVEILWLPLKYGMISK